MELNLSDNVPIQVTFTGVRERDECFVKANHRTFKLTYVYLN